LKILVIEDNVEISEALSFFCGARKDIGCEVVNTGQEGTDRIRAEHFDLILLDVGMPIFSGVDIVNSLKQDGVRESKNVVIVIASSDTKIRYEIRNSGVKGILKKPYSLKELIIIFSMNSFSITQDTRKVLMTKKVLRHYKTLNYCDTILKMTSENNGIICYYRNDSIDDRSRDHMFPRSPGRSNFKCAAI
jgi:DNA-binding response OmpR family regulator